jgi:hypothetical protein
MVQRGGFLRVILGRSETSNGLIFHWKIASAHGESTVILPAKVSICALLSTLSVTVSLTPLAMESALKMLICT